MAPGELVAFLGPNGAGKSTTLRMLTTLLPPTSGTASVAGADVVSNPAEVRSRIGYVGQNKADAQAERVLIIDHGLIIADDSRQSQSRSCR